MNGPKKTSKDQYRTAPIAANRAASTVAFQADKIDSAPVCLISVTPSALYAETWLRESIKRHAPLRPSPLGKRMASNNISHTINDPIHGVMGFSSSEKELIKPIIDHPAFQRLRHIKQLGLADLVFPGATHTRFNHCIGACYLARNICEQIGIAEPEKDLVLMSALLHDIGHGPFSHAFEQLFEKDGKVIVKHEDWTESFLKLFVGSTKITAADVPKIASYIKHESSDDHLSADIISSQLDADRLDYLLRDSHFCGVSYGVFDLKWLLNSLVKITETVNPPRLGISRKGIGVVEHYLMARRLMTQNVYYHGKTKAAEFLLVEFLKSLKKDIEEPKTDITNKCSKLLLEFLKIASRTDDKAKIIADGFQYYRSLSDHDVWSSIRDIAESGIDSTTSKIANRLYFRKLPIVHRLESTSADGATFLVDECRKKAKLEKWQLTLLNLPVKSYKSDKDPILVKEVNEATTNLHGNSFVMNVLADRTETTHLLVIDTESANLSSIDDLKKQLREKNYLATKAA